MISAYYRAVLAEIFIIDNTDERKNEMKKLKMKRFWGLVLAFALVLTSVPLTGLAETGETEESAAASKEEDVESGPVALSEDGIVASGTCGKNISWKLDSDGTMTIRGSGDMYNYTGYTKVPWYGYQDSITSIAIEDGVTSIGNYSFISCVNAESITIANTVLSIGECAFWNCSSLKRVNISSNVNEIGNGAFALCSSVSEYSVDKDNSSYTDLNGVLFNKDISELMYYPAQNQNVVYSVPSGVSTIHALAFAYTDYLNTIEISDKVKNIANRVFYYSSVENIKFIGSSPDFVEESFYRVTAVAYYPYNDSTWTEDILQDYGGTITWKKWNPETGEIIDDSQNNSSITFDQDYTCEVGKSISITATYISEDEPTDITWKCSDENAVTFSDTSIQGPSVTGEENTWWISTMVTGAIAGSYDITLLVGNISGTAKLNIQNKTNSCGENLTWLFEDNTLTISGTGEMYDYGSENPPWTDYTNEINTIVIEDGVTSIGDYAFFGCENVSSVTLSDGVANIGEFSFSMCYGLSSIIIPMNVTSIGMDAFSNCTGLSQIYFKGSAPTFGTDVFIGVTSTAYYPEDDSTWTDDVKQNYGGTIKWKAWADNDCFSASKDGWCFYNHFDPFGYDNKYKIPMSRYSEVYLDTVSFFDITSGIAALKGQIFPWNGNCFGMSLLAAANYNDDVNLKQYFTNKGDTLAQFGYSEIKKNSDGQNYYSIGGNDDIIQLIEKSQISQLSDQFSETEIFKNDSDYSSLIEYVQNSNDKVILVSLEGGMEAHAVLIDNSQKIEKGDDGWYYISIYDPNIPQNGDSLENPADAYNKSSLLAINVVSGDWRYYTVDTQGNASIRLSNEYSFLGHGYIKFYDTGLLGGNYFKYNKNLTTNFIDSTFLLSMAENIEINDGNDCVMNIEDNIPTQISEGYDYMMICEGINDSTLAKRLVPLQNKTFSYSSSKADIICGSVDACSLYCISTDGDSSVEILTENDSFTITSKDDTIGNVIVQTSNNINCISFDFTLPKNNNLAIQIDEKKLVMECTTNLNLIVRIVNSNNEIKEKEISINEKTVLDIETLENKKMEQNINVNFTSKEMFVNEIAKIEAVAQGALTYKSNDSSIATVDQNGIITAVAPGNVMIIVVAAETEDYNPATTTIEITVTEKPQQHTHEYGDPVFEWAEDYSCKAVFTCKDKDDEQTLDCTVTSEVTDPTCTKDGETVYTATIEFDGQTYTDTKTVPGDPATGHSYEYTDNGDGTHTATCVKEDDSFTEDHIFKDGVCICGAKEETPSESESESESSSEPENPEESESSSEPENPEESESSEPSKPAETVKPWWKAWLEKWFGDVEDPEETPEETPSESESATEPEQPSESESESPTEPEQPSEQPSESAPENQKPGFNIWDWLFGWWW